jgi:hypothetical protein
MQNYYKDQGKSINSLNNLKGMKLASLNINTNNTPRSRTIFKFSEIGVEEVTAGLRNLKILKYQKQLASI